MGDRVGKWIQAQLKTAGYDIILIDPLETELPLLKQPIHFIEKYDGPESVPENLSALKVTGIAMAEFVILTIERCHQIHGLVCCSSFEKEMYANWMVDKTNFHFPCVTLHLPSSICLQKKIESADCFVFVTSEYNRTLPPALTNFMDHFPPSLFYHRPSAIVSYSIGSQGGIAANMALRGFLCEFGCAPIPANMTISDVSSRISEKGDVVDDADLQGQGKKMLDQLAWYARALKDAKVKSEVPC